MELQCELSAEMAAVEQEMAAGAAETEADRAAAGKLKWAKRNEDDEGRWRASAPSLGAALLQHLAAPDPDVLCASCQQKKHCTIR
jgi:hypothetical protein